MAGNGPASETVARLAAPLGDAVVLAGSRSDVMPVFDAVDVCLHPSRADAFPTTLLEAMAASVPVVATKVGGIPEIIEDGREGILLPAPPTAVDVCAPVVQLIRDPQLRRALGRAGRERYEGCFAAALWVERTRELYDEVLRESGALGRGFPIVGRCSAPERALWRLRNGARRSVTAYRRSSVSADAAGTK